MILAAGRGERMRPLTDTTPKPLLMAGGKPLIVWHIESLARAGFTELVINHAWLGAQIESALGDGSQWGVHIAYSAEGEALETAGGIAKALPLLGDAPFLIVNGDIHTYYEFAKAREIATAMQTDADLIAWLVLTDNPPHHAQGDFALEDGVCKLEGEHKLTYTGIGVYRPQSFAHIVSGTKAALGPMLKQWIAAGQVRGEHHRARWVDVGTPQRLAALDMALTKCSKRVCMKDEA